MQTQALSGIKVIDLSRVLAAPSATQILADMGAEVIKIEQPSKGDETRHWSPPKFDDGTSAYFATVNRNKRSLTLDITTKDGQEIIRKLVATADVFVENFKVGNLKKYGLDYDSLRQINPHLIYASLTGFGQTGGWAGRAGYDYIVQGLSGLMSITGESEREPQKVGVAVVDLFAGMQLTTGILTALLARHKTGVGQQVDVALLDSSIAMLANVGMNALATDTAPKRLGNAHPSIVPYQVFYGADGAFILACGNDSQFVRVSELMGQDWHNDESFATNPKRVANREKLTTEMQAVFATKPCEHWLSLFDAAQVPCGPINDVREALNLPQIKARAMIVDFDNSPVKVLGNPIKLSATPVQYRTPPPTLGQDTDRILAEIGLTDDEIDELKNKGVV